MRNTICGLVASLLVAAWALAHVVAQSPRSTAGGWITPDYNLRPLTDASKKPAPRRSLVGTWIPFGRFGVATQAGGVSSKPNNGRPENQLPYTPFGLELYKSHKALEGADAVRPAEGNDPRNLCEPLGMPRINHYNLNVTQIFQDDYKVAILYQYDNRWRVIWTDDRVLPKPVDGAVDVAGEIREQRFFGYSVGRWVDDYTVEAQTVGTMPEDRVWLDATGRPISDQLRVTVIATGLNGQRRAQAPISMVHSAPVQRTGTDNVPVLTQPLQAGGAGQDYSAMNTPSVWRSGRAAAAKVDALASNGMDEIEIPAFLRKQAD